MEELVAFSLSVVNDEVTDVGVVPFVGGVVIDELVAFSPSVVKEDVMFASVVKEDVILEVSDVGDSLEVGADVVWSSGVVTEVIEELVTF